MKIIKFRAWNISQKEMVYPGNRDERDYIAWQIFIEPDEDYIGLQFTGLKDKKGKEIYEGDIVKFKNKISYVEEVEGCFVVYKNEDEFERYLRDMDVEVIGNKFENPELLK